MLGPCATGVAEFVLESFDLTELTALGSIILIDIVMSGDNAIVIGMAAAGLPLAIRKKAIVIGILAATILRICFALVTYELLSIIGLLFAGGILLLWVCWRMWREISEAKAQRLADEAAGDLGVGDEQPPVKTLRQALMLIVVADVSMSLDNVLAVAGAAQNHQGMLVFGLVLSIALMAFAANYIADLLQKHHWIAYLGLGVVLYVSLDMIWRGGHEIMLFAGVT
jgi:YjbE family integral membrane protein